MNRSIFLRVVPWLALALSLPVLAHEPGARAADILPTAPIPDAVSVPLDAAALAALPREPVEAVAHGKALHCEGVTLTALLQASGAMPRETLRGSHLARRVELRARDGYRVTFALADFDPELGAVRAVVVDRCDGRPLPADDGPLRLIVPAEKRPARWIRQLVAVDVLSPR
ncbi:molybdopterin-binding protein [Montanilutibacter psychrotolerans]|uniref:Molybdopterin-binding protein n=1 Tax=Montanilutibacter psychrotolerans TaxID=1327343 RepID=A0A3M8SYL6_9GAMM|nr:molybdopterin-binding protein [Lysobacter psychrotolerans]RNF85923.1 molybdopterin-binding protein [Lysobacter psychrotolerans]